MHRSGPTFRRRGFSVVELIISIALLAVVMTAMLLSMRGSRNESEKSKNFFSAMSIAQKILDDLDNRCRTNLFTVRTLEKGKLTFSVLEPDIPFFRFLEDTNGDGRLDNDRPMSDIDPTAQAELATFTCTVAFDREHGNGFALATVTVAWEDEGKPHKYVIEHNVPDIPTSVLMDSGANQALRLEDRHLVQYLFDKDKALDELLVEFSVGRDLCQRFSEIMYLSRVMSETLIRNYDRISKINKSLERDTVQGLYDLAWLHEANAITVIQGYTQLAVPIKALEDGGITPGKLFKNFKAGEILQDMSRISDTVYSHTNNESFAMRFNYEMIEATNVYMRLLTESKFLDQITYRQREGLIQKIADLCTALAQNHRGGIMLTLGGRRMGLDTYVDETLGTLAKFIEGKDYNRAAFIKEKMLEAKTRTFSVHEDVSDKFELMAAVAGVSSTLLKKVMVMIQVSKSVR